MTVAPRLTLLGPVGRGLIVGISLALAVTGCPGSPTSPRKVTVAPASGTAIPTIVPPLAVYTPPAGCHVTPPGTAGPPGVSSAAFFGTSISHGNVDLWVGGLGTNGVMVTSGGWKLGWWRFAEGRLAVTGRRLDGPAPPLKSSVPDGYGRSGFQASAVEFPTEGCWEITGMVGRATLTFVTYVIKLSQMHRTLASKRSLSGLRGRPGPDIWQV